VKTTRRRFLRTCAIGTGIAAGLGFYTWRLEPHWVEFVQRRLPLLNLPQALAGKRLVQLSDLHIGPQVDDRYLVRSFDSIRALAPEIIAYTGDFISYEAEIFGHAQRVLAHLPLGTFGTVGILGNHDYGPRWSRPTVAARIADLATGAGVRVLRNQVADIHGLQIIGLDDLWARQFDAGVAFAGVHSDRAALALSHNPDTADLPGWEGFAGWILAGHTHGGQCKPPFLPPPMTSVKNRRYTSGEFALSGGRRMYISRGLGHLLRVRFNARPEITVFHLERV
jgi:predicted MPP superfamily phosphohydrolase